MSFILLSCWWKESSIIKNDEHWIDLFVLLLTGGRFPDDRFFTGLSGLCDCVSSNIDEIFSLSLIPDRFTSQLSVKFIALLTCHIFSLSPNSTSVGPLPCVRSPAWRLQMFASLRKESTVKLIMTSTKHKFFPESAFIEALTASAKLDRRIWCTECRKQRGQRCLLFNQKSRAFNKGFRFPKLGYLLNYVIKLHSR